MELIGKWRRSVIAQWRGERLNQLESHGFRDTLVTRQPVTASNLADPPARMAVTVLVVKPYCWICSTRLHCGSRDKVGSL